MAAQKAGTTRLQQAKADAEAAAARARTDLVKRFAPELLSEADALLKKAGAPTEGSIRAASYCDEAVQKYDQAIQSTQQAADRERAGLVKAKSEAERVRQAVGQRERLYAAEEIKKGDDDFTAAEAKPRDYPADAAQLYSSAQEWYEKALRKAKQVPPPPTAAGPLRVAPSRVQIDAAGNPQRVQLFRRNNPLPAQEVTSFTFTHDMFQVVPVSGTPGAFLISTIPGRAHAGTYNVTFRSRDELCQILVEVLATSTPSRNEPHQ
jgi:hypothetical protein